MPLPQARIYTIEDIYNLPEGERAELIDGQIYYMAPPARIHQKISGELFATIRNYIKSKEAPASRMLHHSASGLIRMIQPMLNRI